MALSSSNDAFKLRVFRQSQILSTITCILLSYFLSLEEPKDSMHIYVLLAASLFYVVVLIASFRFVADGRLSTFSCLTTLFLIGYFLSNYPVTDSPALPWLCVLPTLLIFFLEGRKLQFVTCVVVVFLALRLTPTLLNPQPHLWLSSEHATLLTVSAVCAFIYSFFMSFALWNINNKQKKCLFEQNIRDPLTGAFNRRGLEWYFERRRQQSNAQFQGMGVVMVDIDDFKKVNDQFGHDAGDKVLKVVADAFSSVLRARDFMFRYGGEEFVLLFDNIDKPDLHKIADRIRLAVKRQQVNSGQNPIRVTVSAGCVHTVAEYSDDFDQILQIADKKLYEAKYSGKDRVVHYAM